MDYAREPHLRLRRPAPTPASEICACPSTTPVKLMSTGGLGFNPIHCLECNLEVPPQRLGLDPVLKDGVATWLRTYGAIDTLELESGHYEAWARAELLNPDSPPNREGLELTRQLNAVVRTYFWFWQPQGDDDWQPPTACAVCGGPLMAHDSGLFPQLLCENDNIVVVGG